MADNVRPAWQCTTAKRDGTPCVLPLEHRGYHQSPPFKVGHNVGFDLWKGAMGATSQP